jgi:oligopeptide/dipeptide ABC transporter ATP-binding protein
VSPRRVSADAARRNGRPADPDAPLVRIRALVRHFPLDRHNDVKAVDGVDLDIPKGAALGLVGESGSGKTTLGRCLLRLIDPSEGSIEFDGHEVTRLGSGELRALRARMQMVFQDPLGSLDPRQRVFAIVEEPLLLLTDADRDERRSRVVEIIEQVRLSEAHLERYPHQLSGGQQQRVGIARALVTRPELCVLDEPTSALDWPVRAEILELLGSLRVELGLSYLVISHDLTAVRRVCDRIAVMYLGRIVEEGPTPDLFARPAHPYTKALLSARLEPQVNARRVRSRLGGDVPSPVDPPSGCHLHPRCPIAVDDCARVRQDLLPIAAEHRVACMRVTDGDEIDWPPDWQPGGELRRTTS